MSDGPIGRIRVIVAEPVGITRDSLRALLAADDGLEVIASHGSLEDSLAAVLELEPDLLLTEMLLTDGGSGLELISRAVARLPRTGCVVLAQEARNECVREALNGGASGFVLKQATKSELLTALKIVHSGERYLCRASAARVLSAYLTAAGTPAASGPMACITPREREVLVQVAIGNSNKIIARGLGVSPKTVEKHRSNVMRKLDLRGVAAVTAFAVTHGLAGRGVPAP